MFDWKPISSAPLDGSSFVSLRVIRIAGLDKIPLTIEPDLSRLQRTWIGTPTPGRGGYWQHAVARCSIGDFHGYWMAADAFDRVLASLASWRDAPRDRPIALVRPGSWLDAAIVWPDSMDGRAPDTGIQPSPQNPASGFARWANQWIAAGYLDGRNTADHEPMRWCEVADLIPAEHMERR